MGTRFGRVTIGVRIHPCYWMVYRAGSTPSGIRRPRARDLVVVMFGKYRYRVAKLISTVDGNSAVSTWRLKFVNFTRHGERVVGDEFEYCETQFNVVSVGRYRTILNLYRRQAGFPAL